MTIARKVAVGIVGVVGLAVASALAAPPKPKIELVLDTPENALKTYVNAWKATDFAGIMACIKVTDADKNKAEIVSRYVTYMMWTDALERACAAKFGEDDAMKALGHVRTLAKQYDIDLKRVISANVEYEKDNRGKAKIFLRVEKDRPEGLRVDELFFRDDYVMVREGTEWKVDFLKTYKLDAPDKDSQDAVLYYATKAYPALTTRMKQLTEDVKAGKIKLADDVDQAIKNEWAKLENK
jgi:hypothetical protein